MQVVAAAAGLFGGKFHRCGSILWQVFAAAGPLQGLFGGEFLATARPSGGKFRRCRSILRQVFAAAGPLQGRCTGEKGEWGRSPPPFVQVAAAAVGLFGGNCLLQGRCEAVTLAPLLMVLLFWNILSAIFKLCCFSSDSLQVAVSFCVVSNQNRNGTELQFSICMLTRWCC